MTGSELYEKLLEMKRGGATHTSLIQTCKDNSSCGYDISEDETMILVDFHKCRLVVSPYHQISLFNLK